MENYMNSHQFFDEVWTEVPESLISNQYMAENDDLLKEITFQFYQDYAEDRISVHYAAKKITEFFILLFKYKPLLRNIVDDYSVNSIEENEY